jgi:transcriptional regulator with XRE-family HTH domain
MKPTTKLGKYLKNIRRSADLSQSVVGKALGYGSAQFVSNWERGLSQPPVEVIKALGQMYSVDPNEIFEMVVNESVQVLVDNLKRKYEAL